LKSAKLNKKVMDILLGLLMVAIYGKLFYPKGFQPIKVLPSPYVTIV